MGAWSYHIWDSDDAMDAECDILDAIGCMVDGEPVKNCNVRSALEQHLSSLQAALVARIASWRQASDEYLASDAGGQDSDEGRKLARRRHTLAVEGQVLAAFLMNEGCAFSADVRDWLVSVASDCYEYRLGIASPEEVRARLEALGALDELDMTLKERQSARIQGRTAVIQDLLDKLRAYDLGGGTAVSVAAPWESIFEPGKVAP